MTQNQPKIIDHTGESTGTIPTVTTHTGKGQRETLEAVMLNLATCLGIEEIHKRTSSREAVFYSTNKGGGGPPPKRRQHHFGYVQEAGTLSFVRS